MHYDVQELLLDDIRQNPFKYLITGSVWQFNFAMLHICMRTDGLELNPHHSTDISVADYITLHHLSITDWVTENADTDVFIKVGD